MMFRQTLTIHAVLLVAIAMLLLACQPEESNVIAVSAMKKTVRKGQLKGNFDVSQLLENQNVYGLGPVAYLRGELLVSEGVIYRSTVLTDKTMLVEEVMSEQAPFFVYSEVEEWVELPWETDIADIKSLEDYIDKVKLSGRGAFAFRLQGIVDAADIHVVNLPVGREVSSHEEAHEGMVHYTITDREVEIVGFFSKQHKGIYTHHDAITHMHLLTSDKRMMGHLDDIRLDSGSMKLYVADYR